MSAALPFGMGPADLPGNSARDYALDLTEPDRHERAREQLEWELRQGRGAAYDHFMAWTTGWHGDTHVRPNCAKCVSRWLAYVQQVNAPIWMRAVQAELAAEGEE